MFLEAIISFLLLVRLRKTLQTFSPDPTWDRWLKIGMIAVGVLFLLEGILHLEFIIRWIWLIVLPVIISLPFREERFYPVRMTMYAVMPLVIISLLSNIIAALWQASRFTIHKYEEYAYPVAITWLIALLILSRRQLKALKQEHKRRLEEEERLRQMAIRKAELEAVVAERTAELQQQKEELQETLKELRATQTQLIQREKMASLGELTAGVAHEIKNPLNFINNFSELSVELADEIQSHVSRLKLGKEEQEELSDLLHDLIENQKKIHHHGGRADAIVKSMLQHSRTSDHEKEPTDVNALVDEYLRLSYHGIRAKDKLFTAVVESHLDPGVEQIVINAQEIGRVLLNVYNNAFYAVHEKKKQADNGYEPLVQVSTKKCNNGVEIKIRDNGTGIPEKVLNKIYQPFFTTKPTGEGTGLGLSLSYDIITKGHNGELKVETKEGEFTTFIITIPNVVIPQTALSGA
jgi:signal transduction histidine kinase